MLVEEAVTTYHKATGKQQLSLKYDWITDTHMMLLVFLRSQDDTTSQASISLAQTFD
jgi:hypothetical protein